MAVALGIARGLEYGAIALFAGTLVFSVRVVPAALRTGALAGRLDALQWAAIALGVLAGALGLVAGGAWALWAPRVAVVIGAAGAIVVAGSVRARPALGLAAAYLVVTPALAGPASEISPRWLASVIDVAHVGAASVWSGGVACLVLAVGVAARGLPAPERMRVTLTLLERFSPIALAAVGTIAITGVAQAVLDLRSVHALTHTTFGAFVMIKIGLLGLLIGLAAVNRERVIPTLRRALAGADEGGVLVLARNATAGELAALIGVLAVTAALVADSPPAAHAEPRAVPRAADATNPPPASVRPRGEGTRTMRREGEQGHARG